MSLQNLRDALSDVDRRIIQLVAERQRIVSDIGRDKQSSGTATRDYAREKDVVDRGRGAAGEAAADREQTADDGALNVEAWKRDSLAGGGVGLRGGKHGREVEPRECDGVDDHFCAERDCAELDALMHACSCRP